MAEPIQNPSNSAAAGFFGGPVVIVEPRPTRIRPLCDLMRRYAE